MPIRLFPLFHNRHVRVRKVWLRIACELIEDDRREARAAMLDAYPHLRAMYSEDDGNTEAFYIRNATATYSSFTKAPEVETF